jgi:hypothetical protein
MKEAEGVAAKSLYCGRCYHDRGVLVALTYLQGRRSSSRVQFVDDGPQGSPYPWGCGYCDEERHAGGYHVRAHVVLGGSSQGEESVVHVPHVVAL